MISQEHQQQIRNVAGTGDKECIDSVFKKVLCEEIGMLNVNNIIQDYLLNILSKITVPYTVSTIIENTPIQENQQGKAQKQLYNLVTKIAVLLISLIIVAIISSENSLSVAIWTGIIISVIYFLYENKRNTTKQLTIEAKPNVKITYCVNADLLIETAGQIINDMNKIVNELKVPESQTKPIQLPLHECYKNVLVWLQLMYGECDDFDERTKNFIVKRIVNLLEESYYNVITYDGTNNNYFEIQYEIDRQEPYMFLPAIIHEKTGKLVLAGQLFLPKK